MLHRTKAEQVVPVYLEFIEKYPDIKSLAEVEFGEVKSVTEHLGLHWRSKNFYEAAKYIIKKYKGKFPGTNEELRNIPGVGEYISGAVMAISFSKPAPVVDSNIARFINRFWNLNLAGELRRKKEITKIAEELFNCDKPGDFLFALVDFTSLICKPRKPECLNCPLRERCRSFLEL